MFRRTTLGLVAAAVAGCSAPTDTDAPTREPDGGTPMPDGGTALSLSSPAFDDGAAIPAEYTCEGADRSPALDVAGVPDTAARLALLVDDPDAPSAEPFVHWLLYDVPADVGTIPEAVPAEARVDALDGAAQGTNGFGNLGYGGPCPPRGDGPHTYRFRLFALESSTGLDPGASRDDLLAAVDGRSLARTTLTGTFERG
ncbi:YbhB/YbcL family Raf kinase inhibitor-like protein [Halorarius halobius]|uniref:YbhB/YbcL family Raf kinase inhibitor-like protein n=1 Tax=Halorarius halobius TaxID=2962671 RepID=UPI0020CD182D|nr:YbhB/YbcL family Raf kinase inhibitor-like protein [Halorarius halobius]